MEEKPFYSLHPSTVYQIFSWQLFETPLVRAQKYYFMAVRLTHCNIKPESKTQIKWLQALAEKRTRGGAKLELEQKGEKQTVKKCKEQQTKYLNWTIPPASDETKSISVHKVITMKLRWKKHLLFVIWHKMCSNWWFDLKPPVKHGGFSVMLLDQYHQVHQEFQPLELDITGSTN